MIEQYARTLNGPMILAMPGAQVTVVMVGLKKIRR